MIQLRVNECRISAVDEYLTAWRLLELLIQAHSVYENSFY